MASLLRTRLSVLSLLGLVTGLVWSTAATAPAQAQEGSKGIKSEEVVPRSRGKSRTTRTSASSRSRVTNTYTSNVKRSKRRPARGQEDVRLGVTIFRYEPRGAVYRPGREGTKTIVMEGTEESPVPPATVAAWNFADWTRTVPDVQFAVGQAVRLHIEPLTRGGYLYIVHQELYDGDDSNGPIRLLFPTKRTNNGNNLVRISVDLWVPRAPAYFLINPSASKKTHIGELLTVVLRAEAPSDLLGRVLDNTPLFLEADEFERLVAGAGDSVIRMNLDGGEGRPQTERELTKDINMVGEEALTTTDPLPQTIYETRRRAGQPVVFRIPLRFTGVKKD